MPALAISVWSYETNKKDSPRKGAPMTVSFEGILLLKAHPEKHKNTSTYIHSMSAGFQTFSHFL